VLRRSASCQQRNTRLRKCRIGVRCNCSAVAVPMSVVLPLLMSSAHHSCVSRGQIHQWSA